MSYRVVAPLVLVKVPGVGDDYRVDYHYAGSHIPALTDEQAERFLAEGFVVEVDATEAGLPEKPKKTGTQKAWADYAVSRGADRAGADASTREELIELYGDK